MKKKVLLSFDIEEFDVPREHGVNITLEEGMLVSRQGTSRILSILKQNQITATFFCTGNFASNAPDIIRQNIGDGHEIACHGVDHWTPCETDVIQSKKIVEQVSGVVCNGYRQPRMFPVSDDAIREAGYLYNSSLNPAFIPGRYMHLTTPRTVFTKDGMLQIPASVTPMIRFPLFWLSLHNLPQGLYYQLVKRVLKHDGYFVTYFHPWEFYDLKEHLEFKLPFYIKKNSGVSLMERLDLLIKRLKADGADFITFTSFVNNTLQQ